MPFTLKRNRRQSHLGRFHGGVEHLESRMLLSIAPVQLELAGPYNVAGTTWTYNFTVNKVEADNGFVATAKGATTFPATNGVSCYEIDYTTPAETTKNYFGVSGGDYVNYGNVVPSGTNTNTTVNGAPYNDIFGLSASANQAITGNYTANSTVTNASGATISTSTTQVSTSSTLQSETLANVKVGNTNYQAYMFIGTTTNAGNSVDTMQTWVVPNIGMVQEIDTIVGATKTNTFEYQLSSFQTTQERLVFMPPPANTSANTPIPTTVELLNSTGGLDTSSTDTVALSLNVVSGGSGAQLGGTTSLALSGGIAQFTSSNGPAINATGLYTLTATDTNTSAGVAPQTSLQFGVSDDHLVIKKQPPKEVDVLQPFPLIVELVNSKGEVDKTATADQAQLALETVADGQGAQLAGTTTLTFTDGVADFSKGPNITGVGTFKLLVSVLGTDAATMPVETGEIKTKGYRLALQGSIGEALRHPVFPTGNFAYSTLVATGEDILPGSYFRVDLRSPSGGFAGGNPPNLTVSLDAVEGDGQLTGNPVATFVGNLFYKVYADVTSPGTYTFTLTAQDVAGEDIPASAIAPFKIGPLQVESSQLYAGTNPSKFVYANQDLGIYTGLVTAGSSKDKSQPHGFAATQSAGVSITLSSSTASGTLSGVTAYGLQTPSTFTDHQSSSGSTVQINQPGQYQLTYTEVITPGGQPFDPTNYSPLPGASPIVQTIVVLPDKVKFATQPPQRVDVGQRFSTSLVLTGADGKVLSSFDNTPDALGFVLAIQLTATTSTAAGGSALQNAAAPAVFTDGMATFANLSFSSSSTYRLHATLVLYNAAGNNGAGITEALGSSQAISRGILVTNTA